VLASPHNKTSTTPSCRAKVLSAAATFAEDHTLRLAPFPLDAREQFPSLFATTFEEIKAVIRAAIVWARVAAISGDLQLHCIVFEATSTASHNTR
jgi:hypothetical protein